jgi:hypothetical protein
MPISAMSTASPSPRRFGLFNQDWPSDNLAANCRFGKTELAFSVSPSLWDFFSGRHSRNRACRPGCPKPPETPSHNQSYESDDISRSDGRCSTVAEQATFDRSRRLLSRIGYVGWMPSPMGLRAIFSSCDQQCSFPTCRLRPTSESN